MKILRNILIIILLALLIYLYLNPPQSEPQFSSTSIPSQPSENCPECARFKLTDYRNSPAVFGRKDSLYPSHWENGRLVFDRSIKHDDQFGKTPIAIREGQE